MNAHDNPKMILQYASKVVGNVFGVHDGCEVSKPKLVIAMARVLEIVNSLQVELFFLNPAHPMFEKISGEQRDLLTKLVLERKS